MSKSRFSDTCDVYVYADVAGHVECCACLVGPGCAELHSVGEVFHHLRQHVEAGHIVPAYLFDRDTYSPDDFEPFRL